MKTASRSLMTSRPPGGFAKTAAALVMMTATSFAFAADKVTTVPVKFARGASSATMQGSFSGYDSVEYTLSAKAGQTMTVKVTGSTNANFNVFAPGAKPGEAESLSQGNMGSSWSGRLPATGAYTVQVYQMRASARRGTKVEYSITFDIK